MEIRTNYLQFDSTSSLLGFGLAACPPAHLPHPQVYGLDLLRKNRRQEWFHLGDTRVLLVSGSWEQPVGRTLIKVL